MPAPQYTDLRLDAQGEQIILQRVDATGTPIAGAGSVIIALAATLGTDGTRHPVFLQEITVYDGACNPQRMIVLASAPF